jgi:proline dehydrogenase
VLVRGLARVLPVVPRPLVERVARRYIAGERLEDALAVVRFLNAQGKAATVDVRGEAVAATDEARALAAEYAAVLRALAIESLDGDVSVKLTGFGLELDQDLAHECLTGVVREAAALGNRVEIDMEHATVVDETLEMYRELRAGGFDNVGIVLQAQLRRTVDDALAVAELQPFVRVCKGIYVEPPEVAYQGAETVRFNFLKTVEALLDGGSYVALATHDDVLLRDCLRLVRERGLPRDGYEVQMLLGVRPELGDALVREGHRLRVYVPYGARWYEYSLRRLKESPSVAGAVAREAVGRLLR